ncbi:MAG TPA: diaminobutyrate acetyltransferase [Burkholderiaceae bacterium]|nr:diaminobutyrate acetyltransferase [Burkholderiaceae bacterium]
MTTTKQAPVKASPTPADDGAGGSEPSPHMGVGATPATKTDHIINNKSPDTQATDDHVFRQPSRNDGHAIQQLICQCPPLDQNSVYTYLLLSEHFTQTCVIAESAAGIDGFISAYIHPQQPDTLFVWQVAVHERARGARLGKRMLQSLLQRPDLKASIRYIETTVGPDNLASRGMFASLARGLDADTTEEALFDAALFGPQSHEDERLIRIGPFVP